MMLITTCTQFDFILRLLLIKKIKMEPLDTKEVEFNEDCADKQ